MKADADPVTPLPQPDIPAWVPHAIAQYVGARLLHDDELANIGLRYVPPVCDPRMKNVWRELSRHNSNGGFLHPAIGTNQDTALLELFDAALACWNNSIMMATTTQRAAELERDRCLAKAAELEHDAIIIMLFRHKSGERYQKLMDAARAYEDHANESYAAKSAMALERKHDGQARLVALTIGNTFRNLFGSPMYGLTATIISVVLGREIELRTVRLWLQTRA